MRERWHCYLFCSETKCCAMQVTEGGDADLLVLDEHLRLVVVIAKGVVLKSGGYTKRGFFET